jgi:hypothetical protein
MVSFAPLQGPFLLEEKKNIIRLAIDVVHPLAICKRSAILAGVGNTLTRVLLGLLL